MLSTVFYLLSKPWDRRRRGIGSGDKWPKESERQMSQSRRLYRVLLSAYL
jgi:hypothetical protein